MRTVTQYKGGDLIRVRAKRRGGQTEVMRVVAPWANGEGNGVAAVLHGQHNHDAVDVPASRIIGPAKASDWG